MQVHVSALVSWLMQWRSPDAKTLHSSQGDNWKKQLFSSIVSLFKIGTYTYLKAKNSLPEGANSIF